jgi:putative PIN family toxin of toxin-antitoxin system
VRRPKLRRYEISDEDVADLLVLIARELPEVDVDVEIRDPADAPVVAAAVAGAARAIVTGDADLLENDDLRAWLRTRDIELFRPAEFIAAYGLE